MTYSGVRIEYNAPTWYLSAMFICMLPLAYMLYKNREFTLYVFSPLTAVLSLGYMAQTNNYVILPHTTLYGVVLGGIVRAMCGLCFGIVSWLIYNRLKRANMNKRVRFLLTILEVVLWIIFFWVWFFLKDNASLFSVLFILPIALAITFSDKSYISRLFRFRWMRFLAPLSMTIYLNHWGAMSLTMHLFLGRSYKFCITMMALFTVAACLLNFLIVKLGKFFWKKIKPFFLTSD